MAVTLGSWAQAQGQSVAPVEWMAIKAAEVDDAFLLAATVSSARRAALSARTAGLVAEVRVDSGARVVAGEELLRLDQALAELAVARARAAKDAAELQAAESERRRAETEQLRESRSISVTEAAARVAEARVAAARVAELSVDLREAEERLVRHVVVAPFAGVVSRKLTEAGEWVGTGTPVLELVSTAEMRMDVRVPQERFGRLREDTVVEILPRAGGDVRLPGRITALVPVGDEAARTFLVRVEPREPNERLVAGMAVGVEFRLLSEEAVVAVPRDALVRRPDGTVNVWLAVPEGAGWKATQRRVQEGRRFATTVELRSGVAAGDRVIVRGNETLREGQAVAPQ
jgi:RND family efflux transporter MFP subunit